MSARGAAPTAAGRANGSSSSPAALSSSLDALPRAAYLSPNSHSRRALAVRDGLVGSRRALRASSAGARVAPVSPSRRRDGFRAPRSRRRFVLVVRLLSSVVLVAPWAQSSRRTRASRPRSSSRSTTPTRRTPRDGTTTPWLWRRSWAAGARGSARRATRRSRLRHGSRGGPGESSRRVKLVSWALNQEVPARRHHLAFVLAAAYVCIFDVGALDDVLV